MMAKKRPDETTEEAIERLLKEITPAQREALLHRQLGMFDAGTLMASGPAVGALRRKGLVGRQKHVTDLGASLCRRLEAAA